MRQRAGSSARGATTTKGEDTYFANGFRNPLEVLALLGIPSRHFSSLRCGGGVGAAAVRRRESSARSGDRP